MPDPPAIYGSGQRLTQYIIFQPFKGFMQEGLHQHGPRLIRRHTARPKIKKTISIQSADGRAMTALHIIGIDF